MDSEPPLASIARDGGRVVLWDADFAHKSPLFWALGPALARLAGAASFPSPETIDEALAPLSGMRFERQRPVPRRRRGPRDPESMYDARIAKEGCVPTRPGSWHDLMNALVWATFPQAKRALHERQHGLVVPAEPGESARRPPELDALALLDEGGLIVGVPASVETEEELAALTASGEATAIVFGHAIYEGVVLGRPAPLASVVCVQADLSGRDGPSVAAADRALAAVVADRSRITDPRAMMRLRADERIYGP